MRSGSYDKRTGPGAEVVQMTTEESNRSSFFSSFMNRWYSYRDRILASPRFQAWAATFPLTRPIARRRARDLFNLGAGFVYSQVLVACVRLNLFNILYEGPQDLATLAQRLELDPKPLERLLVAAKALDLVNLRGPSIYGLGEVGATIVGNNSYAEIVKHHHLFYNDLRDPVALLKGDILQTELKRYWSYASASQPSGLSESQVSDYSALMSVSQNYLIEDVLDVFSLSNYECLLDIGGGEGAFLSEAAVRYPKLNIMLFDLPSVVSNAEQRFKAAGVAHRAQIIGGDFFADALPEGADIISLVRIILDHDDKNALAILKAAHKALPKNGVVLIAEPLSGTPGSETITDAYFGFYLLAMGQGGTRTYQQHKALLIEAGFTHIRSVRTRRPFLTGLLVAHP